ncbi:uncharacterized protein LOC124921301 [Impatiens glandulifera]|uniref:uncharacterized protein LOC124921301 n=1 Tax=Impatiens glandulifera TaxID=253017 RepID=UPI001FB15650|nr:uncharacterized protein LOC124921301 [Impatiens glandulifera]
MRKISAIVLLLWVMMYGFVSCKECTNQVSSHTLRYQMSINETLQKEMLIGHDHHYHLTPTDESAWSELLPVKDKEKGINEQVPWLMMYRKIKTPLYHHPGVDGNFLKEISLHYVRLDPESLHGQAQQTNLEYLLMLDVDSLVWSFRATAGLPTLGQPYSGWEDPSQELRGHFVGHYLSATAQMWASTHNDALKRRMTAVVSALSACQFFMGSGYLSAFPTSFFDRFEQVTYVWAPYYTIHKIMTGLLDQYILASNSQALKVVNWMADYFFNRVQNVIFKYSIERHWLSLNEETGGMNELLYRLYIVTGNKKHLLLAHLFDKPCFLGLLAVKADDISGFHANTHIPIVVGSQMRYEVTGEPLYKEIGMFFMDIVNSSHVYATGGTSVNELWSEPNRLASTLGNDNEESCTTYNMLKISRNLFRWTKEMAYADYYERALTNGVMSIQRGREPGVMIYLLPLGPGSSKATTSHGWGNQFDSFWCCYGTGIESFSKLGDSIYFEEGGDIPGLYIIQYISSSINWRSGQIMLTQKVQRFASFDPHLRVTLTASKCRAGVESTFHLRIPSWSYFYGSKALLNEENLALPSPGKFLSITRKWKSGDKITLELPFGLRTEAIKDDRPEYSSLQAVLYGPYLLAGLSNGDSDIKTSKMASLSDWITPIPITYNSQLISLSQQSGDTTFVFTNSNDTITLEKYPSPGTDAAVHATFRLIRTDSKISSGKAAIGKYVMLEPMDFPGKLVAQRGAGEELVVADYGVKGGTVFHMVEGLGGDMETVSLESDSERGCFVLRTGSDITLSCRSNLGDLKSVHAFEEAASFKMEGGISEYHPVSFVAKGANRNFLLSPLFNLRDESYTVYFNVHS